MQAVLENIRSSLWLIMTLLLDGHTHLLKTSMTIFMYAHVVCPSSFDDGFAAAWRHTGAEEHTCMCILCTVINHRGIYIYIYIYIYYILYISI